MIGVYDDVGDSGSYEKMRNEDLKNTYLRTTMIPNNGHLEHNPNELLESIVKESLAAANDSLSIYTKGSSTKPGTIPHDIALFIKYLVEKTSNPNAVDREMFRGAANMEKDVISMTARLFGKSSSDNPDAGYLLSGGTESLNQVTLMLRNKYFQNNLNQDVRTQGLAESIMNASDDRSLVTGNHKMIRPRILLPVNYHFCGIKGTDLLGLGTNSLAFYGLDQNFDIDEESLRKTLKSVYDSGDDIIYSLAVAGDTMHGKVHDIRKLSDIMNELGNKYKKQPVPIVVDSAGSYMFIGVMKDNKMYDGILPEVSFKIPDVEAIVGDPHKQPLPYSCGLLMLKDWNLANYTDVRNIAKVSYLDMDDKENQDTSAALATIPTSRSGANAFAIHAYLKYMGMSGLRQEKEKIWSQVKDFRDYVNDSKDYEIVCEPQTQVVSFRFNGSGEDNINIYKNIKNSDKDFCYISHDDKMLARNEAQLKSDTKEYAGLFITVMEHNTPQHMDKLKSRLEEEAYLIQKNKKK